jgi:mannose-6-phosphate isomerase-like protein (cupin superfamily)
VAVTQALRPQSATRRLAKRCIRAQNRCGLLRRQPPRQPSRPQQILRRSFLNAVTFQQFEADARAQGFSEVLQREWAPSSTLDTHVHAFAVRALVVRGEMWLTVGPHTRHLQAGDSFELECDVPHAERYGGEGATYWVARRSGTASSPT